jgi:hypothetical protein
MKESIMREAGLDKEVDRAKAGLCPRCKQKPGPCKDALSRREFEISGLCQACQDIVFAPPQEEDDE